MTRSSFWWHYCQQLFLHLRNCSRKTSKWRLRPKQQLCSILYRNAPFYRGFSYATHFWYNCAYFRTAAEERIGYICSGWAHWQCAGYSPTKQKQLRKRFFIKYMTNSKNECEKYDVPLLIPRRCKRQIYRDNYPSDDPEHFFRKLYLYRIEII